MKQIVVVFIFIILTCALVNASNILNTFDEKYKALEPQENTSVRSDYLFEQMALGSEYTIKMLDQLNTRNEELNEKFDAVLEKFNIIIEQNKKLIQLIEKNKEVGSKKND